MAWLKKKLRSTEDFNTPVVNFYEWIYIRESPVTSQVWMKFYETQNQLGGEEKFQIFVSSGYFKSFTMNVPSWYYKSSLGTHQEMNEAEDFSYENTVKSFETCVW